MIFSGINHLAFITPDMDATIRFYRDLLELELVAGIGHDGYRHYFFRLGNTQVAFFQYEGASKAERKFPGNRTERPVGFDHVSFTVGSCEDLFRLQARLEKAGLEVTGPVDHGTLWSIYFYDNNELALEASWDCMAITRPPALEDDRPLPVAEEGAGPQPGHWEALGEWSPPAEMSARPGNGHDMRKSFESAGTGHRTDELRRLIGDE